MYALHAVCAPDALHALCASIALLAWCAPTKRDFVELCVALRACRNGQCTMRNFVSLNCCTNSVHCDRFWIYYVWSSDDWTRRQSLEVMSRQLLDFKGNTTFHWGRECMSEATKSSDDFFWLELSCSEARQQKTAYLLYTKFWLQFHTTNRSDGTEGACENTTTCTALWYACARVYRH